VHSVYCLTCYTVIPVVFDGIILQPSLFVVDNTSALQHLIMVVPLLLPLNLQLGHSKIPIKMVATGTITKGKRVLITNT